MARGRAAPFLSVTWVATETSGGPRAAAQEEGERLRLPHATAAARSPDLLLSFFFFFFFPLSVSLSFDSLPAFSCLYLSVSIYLALPVPFHHHPVAPSLLGLTGGGRGPQNQLCLLPV